MRKLVKSKEKLTSFFVDFGVFHDMSKIFRLDADFEFMDGFITSAPMLCFNLFYFYSYVSALLTVVYLCHKSWINIRVSNIVYI